MVVIPNSDFTIPTSILTEEIMTVEITATPLALIREPNDIIPRAIDTQLSALNPSFSVTSEINFDANNVYLNEDGTITTVDATEDVDIYKVSLKAGDTLKINTDSNQYEPGRKVDTALRVFDETGQQLAISDDGAAPDEIFTARFQSYIEFTAPADGTYYIGVSLFNNFPVEGNEEQPGYAGYNPLQPASGSSTSASLIDLEEFGPGPYTLNISLNNPDAFTAPPTQIPPSTGEGPVISLQTVTGTYGSDFENLGFDIISTGLVETAPEDAGSAFNIVLIANAPIPEGGIEVFVNSNIGLPNYFGGNSEAYSVAYGGNLNNFPFSRGGDFLDAVYDATGKATGFKFRLEEPFATITLNPTNRTEAETNGPEEATFSLVASAGYRVNPNASSSKVTFYDTVEQVPAPAVTPEVSLEFSTTELIESEGTAVTLTLKLSEAPPPEGVQVYVSGNAQDALNEFAIFDAQITGGVAIADGAVSGFYFKMLAQTATITLPVFNSTDIVEGIEQFNFSLVPGVGYTINPDKSSALLTLKDTPDAQIQVGLTTEPAVLIESENTVSIHNFSLSAAPPEAGVTVAVSAPNLAEFNLGGIALEGGEIATVRADGFDFKLTAQNASISLPVANDGVAEGVENAIFTLESGNGYQIAPDAGSGTFTLVDTPDLVPPPPAEVEPNDTIATATATPLSPGASAIVRGAINTSESSADLRTDPSEDVDFYAFTIKAGDTVTIDVDSLEYAIAGLEPLQRVDTELRVFNASGTELAYNADQNAGQLSIFGRDPYLEFTAPTDGTYYLGVAQLGNRNYDPTTPGSGSGQIFPEIGINIGEYQLAFGLTPANSSIG